jgi:hypothetical protein
MGVVARNRVGCTGRPRSHVFSVELFAGVPGGLAGYLAAYRVEFRGQPGRSCGPWWRSSCRLWPRPSTWSRAGCAWSTAPHAALVLCRARRAVEPQARHHQVQRPTGLPARRRRHLHLRPAAGMHPRCERHFATTPVAEIVAHSGDGFVDKGAEASATAKRLIVCCDGTWNTLNQAVCGDPCPTNVSQMAGRSRISTGRNATTLLLRGGRRRPVGATQGRPGHRRGAQLVRVHPVDQRPTGRPAGRTGVVRRRAQRRRR